MALNAKKVKTFNSDRPEPLDPGTYPARVVQIIDLGMQEQRPYQGKEKPPTYEIMVTYELLDEFLKDKETGEPLLTKPRWVSESFPFHSLDSDLAKSTKRYYAIDPDATHNGDWTKVGGAPVMVTLVQNKGKNDIIYENVSNVSAMRPKQAEKAEPLVNDIRIFSMDDPDIEIFLSLPTWIQDKIKGGVDFAESPLKVLLEKSGGKVTKKEDGNEKASESLSDVSESDDEEDW